MRDKVSRVVEEDNSHLPIIPKNRRDGTIVFTKNENYQQQNKRERKNRFNYYEAPLVDV